MNERYVSIHARLGHGIGEYTDRFDKGYSTHFTAKCMAAMALSIAREQGINPPRFYLASDTGKFRRELNRALIMRDPTSVLVYGTWGVKHIRHIDQTARGDFNIYLCTFVDLFMLSRGEAVLDMKSGFANLAIWMGSIRSRTIFKRKLFNRVLYSSME
eukprot:IDg16987t1